MAYFELSWQTQYEKLAERFLRMQSVKAIARCNGFDCSELQIIREGEVMEFNEPTGTWSHCSKCDIYYCKTCTADNVLFDYSPPIDRVHFHCCFPCTSDWNKFNRNKALLKLKRELKDAEAVVESKKQKIKDME